MTFWTTLSEDEITRLIRCSSDSVSGKENSTPGILLPPIRPAAVLVPFLRPDGAGSPWHLLFTRRTDFVEHHKGQVSFPGGRTDPEDLNPQFTALREAKEEIGLFPEDVRILGQMEPLITVTNYQVVPVIGVIPWPYPFRLETSEVRRLFTIPLEWLADSSHFEERIRNAVSEKYSNPQSLKVIYYQEFDGEILWGVSAEITQRLLRRLRLLQ